MEWGADVRKWWKTERERLRVASVALGQKEVAGVLTGGKAVTGGRDVKNFSLAGE